MVAVVGTVTFLGIEARGVDVEVQISNGLPAFAIVGLPDKAVAESKERVRAALHALGIALPPKRVTVNLAPADLLKEGSHFDLPIALALLAAMGILPAEELCDVLALGELSLDAKIRPVAGVLPAAMQAAASGKSFICPAASGAEAAWAGELDILAPHDLLQVINHFKGTQILLKPEAALPEGFTVFRGPDLSEVKGQESAKRALEIAAAGGHNLLMIGPPGSGKSMLSKCLPGILPPMDAAEALEVSMIHSLAGMLPEDGLLTQRPFRDPHHSASLPALVGGGQKTKPGEISLAHNGVLFMDELPEFARNTLESLRQPLESGEAVIARANQHMRYPACFQLVAAMNPCRCGYLGDAERECNKAPRCGVDYAGRISGPMIDRFDVVIEVPAVSISDLGAGVGESSAVVAGRISRARKLQWERGQAICSDQSVSINARAEGAFLEQIATLSSDARSLLEQAMERARFSARGYYRILRVARTIADLEAAEEISRVHMAEALSYRRVSV